MAGIFDAVQNGSDETETANRTLRGTTSGGIHSVNRPIPPHRTTAPVPSSSHAHSMNAIERENQSFLTAKLRLEQAKLISQTVSSINSRWKEDNILAADGTNFAQWTLELRETGSSHLSDPTFFFAACDNPTFEKIGRLVIFASVHQSLVPDMQAITKTSEIYNFLKRKFSVISRAAQMSVWRRLIAISINHEEPLTATVTKMKDLYTELKGLNSRLSSDVVFGYIFQLAVMKSAAPFKKDFEQRIENGLQHDHHKQVPRFESIVNNYDICQKQWNDGSANPSDSTVPSVMHAATEGDEFDFDAYLAEVPPENWPDALDFFAATAHRCWQCRAPDHYLRDCPQRVKFNQVNKRLRGPSSSQINQPSHRQLATFVGSLYTQPVNSNNSGHQDFTAPPSRLQLQAKKMADYYRPRYSSQPPKSNQEPNSQASTSKGGASAQLMEIGGVPDDLDDLDFRAMTLGEDIVSPVVIFDTGASHHFSGSKSLLHDFRTLSKPLPLSVATASNKSYITGIGNLRFVTRNSNVVVIKGVLFCEQARTNLISMAALRKADAFVQYDNDRDVFDIYNSHGDMAFSCEMDKSKNRWCLNYPFLRCDVGNSTTPQDISIFSSNLSSNTTMSNVSESSNSALSNSVSLSSLKTFSPMISPSLHATSAKFNPESLFKEPLNTVEGFKWKPESLTKDEKRLLFWHRVFGHAGLRQLRRLIKENLGQGLPTALPHGSIHCPVCAISKTTAVNPLSSTKRTINTMEILAVDLIGPFEVEAVDGSKYLFTLKDVSSGYCFVKPIKSKADANKVIMDTIVRLERLTKRSVKMLRSDNGGEFISKVLADWLAEKGIGTERALPYHHYQNGLIERFNRTVQAMGRTVLIDSSLPKTFWSYAFIWAGHILNRLPNKSSGKITPYEALFGIKPNFDRFRAFGSYAYVHVVKENRLKLDERAKQGQVVAHLETSKGWKFWIPSEGRFIDSALVRFVDDEHSHFAKIGKLGDDKEFESPSHIDPSLERSANRLNVNFVMNLMQLGDFSWEFEFHDQELIVDKILELCQFYAISVPKTFKQAMKSPEKDAWSKAIAVELNNLEQMRVWLVRLMPNDKKALNGRWVFATKPDVDGSGICFKARFAAKGFTQVAGVDFNETFAPTATFVALRLLLVIAARNKWPVHSFDFVAAYLNSPIDEEVWVKPPEGLNVPEGHALLLQKALYGTRQAARCWWLHLRDVLNKLNYIPSQYDNSLYILRHPSEHGVIWLHVDDGVVTASSESLLKKLEADLKDILKIKWQHSLDSIVGLNVERDGRGFQLYQRELVNGMVSQQLKHHYRLTSMQLRMKMVILPCQVDISRLLDHLATLRWGHGRISVMR
jgi:transposase InsO family protein